MKLIVTRPEPAASKTADKLRVLGHEVAVSPVLEIASTGSKIPNGDFSCLIITSANALRVLKQQGFDQLLLNIPLYVVGDATAKKASDTGFTDVRSASGNAANLVELIKSQSIALIAAKKPALYVCGEDSTPGFDDALRKIGLKIKIWINYKAKLVDRLTDKSAEYLNTKKPVGILLYSARSARQFSTISSYWKKAQYIDNIVIFAISSRVKHALPKELQRVTKVAENPDEQSLFALITG